MAVNTRKKYRYPGYGVTTSRITRSLLIALLSTSRDSVQDVRRTMSFDEARKMFEAGKCAFYPPDASAGYQTDSVTHRLRRYSRNYNCPFVASAFLNNETDSSSRQNPL